MPRVGADLANVQTFPTIVPQRIRPPGSPVPVPASYDLPEIVNIGGNPNAFTDAIRDLLNANRGITFVLSGPAVSYGPFDAVSVQERVDPIPPYGQANGAPRGDRVYFRTGLGGWIFAAAVSGYWYSVPGGVDSLGRTGPDFRCGFLPSGAPDYSCFPILNIPQGTLPSPDPALYGKQPSMQWTPAPEPEIDPVGEILVTPPPKPGLGLPLLLGIGAAVLLSQ